MTTSQNPCPALAGIAKAIVSTLSAEDLADVLKSVEPAVMQEALVRSEIVGMDPSHLQLAIDHELVTKEEIFNVLGEDWITGHFATAMGSVVDPSLSYVLGGHTVHEVVDIMEGLYGQDDILRAMGLDCQRLQRFMSNDLNSDDMDELMNKTWVMRWLEETL